MPVVISSPPKHPTPFAPLALPMAWHRTHVAGADVGPSEVWCVSCKRQMLPLAPCGTNEEILARMEQFPIKGNPTGNVPPSVRAEGTSLWCCLFCDLGASVTWGKK